MIQRDKEFYEMLVAKCKLLGLEDAYCRVDGTGLRGGFPSWWMTFKELGVDEALNVYTGGDGYWSVWYQDKTNYNTNHESIAVWEGEV